MKFDFSRVLFSSEGKPLMHGAPLREMTFGDGAAVALRANLPGDENLGWDGKLDRAELAKMIEKGGVVEITSKHLESIKACMGRGYGPDVILAAAEAMKEPANGN